LRYSYKFNRNEDNNNKKKKIINLNNVYFDATKRAIYLKLTKETITILFVLFALNAKKKIKMLLLNKIII